MTLLPWQSEPVSVLSHRLMAGQSALDASDTGTGKTVVAAFSVQIAGLPVGVICPKSTKPGWRETLAACNIKPLFVENIEALKADGQGFLCKVGNRYSWSPKLPYRTVLIFDEVHRFSASDSDNGRILACAPKPVLMLSATAAQDPTKMRAIGQQLDLTTWNDWWHWCGRHGCKKGHFGGIEFKGGKEHLDRLHRQIFGTGRGVRVRISELGDAFPSTSHHTYLVPVENQQAIDEAYAKELESLKNGIPIVDLLRARQISEHGKLAATIEMVEDDVASGNNVAIFVCFLDSLRRLREHFDCPIIHGEQTESERMQAISMFEKARVIAVMIQAGGCGLNGLQDRVGEHPRIGYLFPNYSAVDVSQTLGRLPRADSVTPVQYKWIFAAGTVEENVRAKVDRKRSNIATINDGDLTVQPITHEPQTMNETPKPNTSESNSAPSRSKRTKPAVQPGGPVVSGPAGVSPAGDHPRGSSPAPEPRTHTSISPSKLKYLEISPRWQDEEGEEHPITQAGTRCHRAIETNDNSGLLSNDECRWVGMCRDFDSNFNDEYPVCKSEYRLTIAEGISGTADRIHLDGNLTNAVYLDWKFSRRLQEDAETNPQGQAYALGIFNEWPTVNVVRVYFVYPFLEEISHATFLRKDADQIRLRIETIRARVQEAAKTGRCTPNVESCMYCRHKGTCYELGTMALPIATRYAARKELQLDEAWDPALIRDPAQMAKALSVASVMEKWCESVRHHATLLRQETGQEIPGYDLVQRQGRSTILSPPLAWEVVWKNYGFTNDAFLRAVTVSVPQLLNVAGELAPHGKKAEVKSKLENELRDKGILQVGPDNYFLQRSKK